MSPERRSLLRRLLSLAVVVGLAVPGITLSKRVAVSVDGTVHQLRTYARTVGDLVAAQGIELAAGDQLVPSADAGLTDGTHIAILRTITVGVTVDDQPTRLVKGTFRSVDGALAAAGITDTAGLEVVPGVREEIDGGASIVVRRPREVTVTVDGRRQEVHTLVSRLDLLLVELGIDLRPADRIQPPLSTELTDGLEVTVERVAYDEETVEIVLEHTTERRMTDELFEGTSRTVQLGQDGLRRETWRVTFVDGEETDRVLVSDDVVREPVPQIVEVGTRKRPSYDVDSDSVWYKLAQCESGGRWDYNGPSGYDGGLQFHPNTWTRWKLSGYPEYAWQASAAQQIEVGRRVQRAQGWGAWPSCARKLGLY